MVSQVHNVDVLFSTILLQLKFSIGITSLFQARTSRKVANRGTRTDSNRAELLLAQFECCTTQSFGRR